MRRGSECKSSWLAVLVLLLSCAGMSATPQVKPIGPGLYAYISDNDSSANSTFLIGNKGILVVDTGFDAAEGTKLLQAIRSVSSLPVEYIVISTDWTRERTLVVIQASPPQERSLYQPADVTFQEKLTLHLEPYSAEVYFPGKAHTSGDALVYFPHQRAIAAGDLFLNRSSPAMDVGSVENWIRALDHVLSLPVETVVPGHFELASKKELRRFRDYLNDLLTQVQALLRKGATLEEVRRNLHMERYSDFRQYPQYHATFADNAEVIYQQIQQR